MGKKFKERNESFICFHCRFLVPQHPNSSRNHCTQCLYSLDVDIYPGDRAAMCGGRMRPIGIETTGNRLRIVFECELCNHRFTCIAAPDDSIDAIATISTNPVQGDS